jgi:hypothetical protein
VADYARGGGNSGATRGPLSLTAGSSRLISLPTDSTSRTADAGAATAVAHEVIDAHVPGV